MLEMSCVFAVLCADGPFVLGVHKDGFVSHGDHRLDGDAHARLEQRSVATTPIIGNWRVFVHLAADTVSGEFPDDAVTMTFAMALHRIADIADVFACHGILDTEIKAFLRRLQQLADIVADLTDTKSIGGVAIKTVEKGATVNSDNVTLLQDGLSVGHPMNDNVVDRGTDAARERTTVVIRKILERGDCPMVANERLGNRIELQR